MIENNISPLNEEYSLKNITIGKLHNTHFSIKLTYLGHHCPPETLSFLEGIYLAFALG
jgi:hypothetical protein